MRHFQSCSLELRLTRDPEAHQVIFAGLRRTCIRLEGDHEDGTELAPHTTHVHVEAWDAQGEEVLKHLHRGDLAILEGRFRERPPRGARLPLRLSFVCTGFQTSVPVGAGGSPDGAAAPQRSVQTRSQPTQIPISDPAPLD